MYYVYVLYSSTCDKRYIGQTDDLGRRLNEHNTARAQQPQVHVTSTWTWQLIHSEEFKQELRRCIERNGSSLESAGNDLIRTLVEQVRRVAG